jgi:TPR repeat protein
MVSLVLKWLGMSAAVVLAAGAAVTAPVSAAELDRPVTEAELRELAAAYQRGDLGSGRCDWVHPVTEGPSRIPCEVVPLPVLADMARNVMNKHAQLELGKRLEEGRGVARNPAMARRFYRMAARDSQRGAPLFGEGLATASVAGIGGHTIYSRPRAVGLPEAEERLRALARAD